MQEDALCAQVCGGVCVWAHVQVCPWKNQKPLWKECISMKDGGVHVLSAFTCTCVYALPLRVTCQQHGRHLLRILIILMFNCFKHHPVVRSARAQRHRHLKKTSLTSGPACVHVNQQHLPRQAVAVGMRGVRAKGRKVARGGGGRYWWRQHQSIGWSIIIGLFAYFPYIHNHHSFMQIRSGI